MALAKSNQCLIYLEVETSGEIEEIGEHVSTLKKGDKVIVYNRTFDETCDMCLNQCEMNLFYWYRYLKIVIVKVYQI